MPLLSVRPGPATALREAGSRPETAPATFSALKTVQEHSPHSLLFLFAARRVPASLGAGNKRFPNKIPVLPLMVSRVPCKGEQMEAAASFTDEGRANGFVMQM